MNNDGEKDVLASIIYDGSNYAYVKGEMGASNEMKVTDNHSTPAYAYDATDGAQLTQELQELTAFTVDGISMTRSSIQSMIFLMDLL